MKLVNAVFYGPLLGLCLYGAWRFGRAGDKVNMCCCLFLVVCMALGVYDLLPVVPQW